MISRPYSLISMRYICFAEILVQQTHTASHTMHTQTEFMVKCKVKFPKIV